MSEGVPVNYQIQPGLRLEWSRTIIEEDVRKFSEISGDRGVHHVQPDAMGRLLVQGLLTATLPTKLGGDLNFIARTMSFEFLKPVYAGETLHCVGVVESAIAKSNRWKVRLSFSVTNQEGEIVLTGGCDGMILR